MTTVGNAALLAESKVKNTTATAVIDYDDQYYIVELIDNDAADGMDMNCPYVAVNKKNGSVVGFTPMEDPDKFFDAVENRMFSVE